MTPPQSPPIRGSGKAMITLARIAKAVRRLGREISQTYADIDEPLVIVVILIAAVWYSRGRSRS